MAQRLGYRGAESIAEHHFFSDVNWDGVSSKAPIVPDTKRANFDAHSDDIMAALDVGTDMTDERPLICPEDDQRFAHFNWPPICRGEATVLSAWSRYARTCLSPFATVCPSCRVHVGVYVHLHAHVHVHAHARDVRSCTSISVVHVVFISVPFPSCHVICAVPAYVRPQQTRLTWVSLCAQMMRTE